MGTALFTRCLAAILLLCASSLAAAESVTDPAFNRFRSQVVGNAISYSYGSGGQPLAGGGASTGIGVSGGVDVSRMVSVQTKNGPIIGTLSQRVSAGAMGKAFARAGAVIGGPVGLAFLALPAIVDWMDEAGVRQVGGDFEQRDPASCASNCFTYSGNAGGIPVTSGSLAGYCSAYAAAANTLPRPHHIHTVLSVDEPGKRCLMRRQFYNLAGNPGTVDQIYVGPLTTVSRPPDPQAWIPASSSQVEALMGSVTNPSPEALAELYKLGQAYPAANPVPDLVDVLRAEFDARSPESVETSTTDSAAQTKTQEKTCATYTQMVGSTLSLVENCATTTTTQAKDPVTGQPVGDPVVETTTTGNTTPDPSTRPSPEASTEPFVMPCGVGGAPPCAVKADETGTPTGESFGNPGELDDALDGRDGGLAIARDMAGDTSWGIIPAWTQDHACEPWHIFTLPDFLGGGDVGIDLCPLMPIADGIANFIWVMLGIFAVVGMVGRTITSGGA